MDVLRKIYYSYNTQLCNMVLFFVVIHIKVTAFLKFKIEKYEPLQILVDVIHIVSYINNYKYRHFHPNYFLIAFFCYREYRFISVQF